MGTDASFELAQLALASLVVAAAYLIRGIAGFGSGLIAIPALATFLPLTVVVPVIAVLDLLASLTHGLGNRRVVQWKEILSLLPFSLVGIVTAVVMFKTVDSTTLSTVLAVFIIAYALFSLTERQGIKKASRYWAVPWGGLGGAVNAMFGTGGPFYVIYLKLRALEKSELRATIAMILLLDGIGRLVGYSAAGMFTAPVILLVCAAIPLGGLALYAGGNLQVNLKPSLFRQLISLLLLVSGAVLLAK